MDEINNDAVLLSFHYLSLLHINDLMNADNVPEVNIRAVMYLKCIDNLLHNLDCHIDEISLFST